MELDFSKTGSAMSKVNTLLYFAQTGFPILPLHYITPRNECSCGKLNCSSAAKHPLTKHGLKDASTNKMVITEWYNRYPLANVGILTGKISNLIVLDVDPRHDGDQSLALMQQEFGPLPPTVKVKTGGNGFHFYFKYANASANIPNRANFLKGLDIRADGGYIVAPPSIHATKLEYTWDMSINTIAPIPDWLEELIMNKQHSIQSNTKIILPTPQAQAHLVNQNTANSQPFYYEGTRNNGLCSIGGLLRAKGATPLQIQTALEALNKTLCFPPLALKEVTTISHSVSKYQAPKICETQIWETRMPLPEDEQVRGLTPDLLPDLLKEWCCDIAERMQVPLEFIAGPSIVMFASLIGRKAVIVPKKNDNWQVVPNLWGCIIAPPGSLKSPAIAAALVPLHHLAHKALSQFKELKKQKSKEESLAKMEIEGLKDAYKAAVKRGAFDKANEFKEKLEKALVSYEENFNTREPRYITNDPTIEKLLSILEDNPQGLLLYRDELSGWLETIMHKSGREGDREFFLEAWNGDSSYSMDRIGRGTTLVEGICLSVMGGLQPGKFTSYVSSVAKGGKSDDGLLQRFQLIMYPDRRKHWKKVDKTPNHLAQKKIEGVVARIDQIPLPKKVDDKIHRPIFHYSPSAQFLADEWHEKLENRLCKGDASPILEAHLSKFRSLMPSLSLIFALMREDYKEGHWVIDEKEVKLSIAWCKFLEGQAFKAYGEYLNPELSAGRRLLTKIRDGLVKDGDACRDIYRRGWKGLANKEELDLAVSTLKKYGHLKTDLSTPINGGRSEVIRLHPDYSK